MIYLPCKYVWQGEEKRGVLLSFLSGTTKVIGMVKGESGDILVVPIKDIKVI